MTSASVYTKLKKNTKSFLLLLYSLSKCKLTQFINKCLMNNKMAAVNIYTHYSVVFRIHHNKRQTSTFLSNPESTYTIEGHKHSSKAINTIHRFLKLPIALAACWRQLLYMTINHCNIHFQQKGRKRKLARRFKNSAARQAAGFAGV